MGAWDAGSFQNDKALDWVYDVCQSGDAAIVRTALDRAIHERRTLPVSFLSKLLGQHPTEPFLEADVAVQALAAAEIVAYWLGNPVANFPDDLMEWARHHAKTCDPALVALARQAVKTIRQKSELKDLWEEGNGNAALDWYDSLTDLETRLQS